MKLLLLALAALLAATTTAADKLRPITIADLPGAARIKYAAAERLLVATMQTDEMDPWERKRQIVDYLERTRDLLALQPGLTALWVGRARIALANALVSVGREAGAQLLALGAADFGDQHTLEVLGELELKGWLNRKPALAGFGSDYEFTVESALGRYLVGLSTLEERGMFNITRESFPEYFNRAESLSLPPALLIEALIVHGVHLHDVALLSEARRRAGNEKELLQDDHTRALLAIARGCLAGCEDRFVEAEREFAAADKAWTAYFSDDVEEDERNYRDRRVRVNDVAEFQDLAADKTRTMLAMAKVRVDLDREFATSVGGSVSLRQLLGQNRALFLYMWASWCPPCKDGMPALMERQKQLAAAGVVVVGLNTEADHAKAEPWRQEHGIEFPWLLDAANQPLQEQLLLKWIPRGIVVTPAGTVVYNGPPARQTEIDAVLAKLAR